MSQALLHPPETTTSFTLNGGCGRPHEYDGTGIDCSACIAHVRTLSTDERIGHPALRGPILVIGDNPAEIDEMRKLAEARRERASWRVVEAEAPAAVAAEVPGTPETPEDEIARLQARLEKLRSEPAQAAQRRRPATRA
jgi:hypothetical protein